MKNICCLLTIDEFFAEFCQNAVYVVAANYSRHTAAIPDVHQFLRCSTIASFGLLSGRPQQPRSARPASPPGPPASTRSCQGRRASSGASPGPQRLKGTPTRPTFLGRKASARKISQDKFFNQKNACFDENYVSKHNIQNL